MPLFHTTGQWSRGVALAITARQWLLRHLGTQGVSFLHKGGKRVARPGNPGTCRLSSALVTVWPSQDGGGDERQEGGQFPFLTALLPHSTFQNLLSQPPLVTSLAVPASPPYPHPGGACFLARRSTVLFSLIHSFIHGSTYVLRSRCVREVYTEPRFLRARCWAHGEQNQMRSAQGDDRET